MPRKRKYDYKTDYPIRFSLHLVLPAEIFNELETLGYDYGRMAQETEKFLVNLVKNSKKGID